MDKSHTLLFMQIMVKLTDPVHMTVDSFWL
jgi:hypothetical protein